MERKKKTLVKTVAAGKAAMDTDGGIKKSLDKSGSICRVTFRLPAQAAPGAKTVTIVGDFNGWNERSTPMRKLKSGDFTLTIPLKAGRSYAFRYLIDGTRWENDWMADGYETNPHGTDNSVVVL